MPDKDKKVMDVAKPGSSKPDIGSKPMIIGHKSIAGDPMVKDDSASKEKIAAPSEKNKVIAPLNEDIKEESKIEDKVVDDSAGEAIKVKKATPAKEEKSETVKEVEEKKDTDLPDKTEDKKPDDLKKAENDKDNSSSDKKSSDGKKDGDKIDPAAEALEKEEKLRKIIESKKYNVDIKEKKSGSLKTFVYSFILILLLGFVAVYLLIDYGTIKSDINLPFSVFNKQDTPQKTEQSNIVVTKTAEKDETEDETANWLLYNSKNFTIKIPEGWEGTNYSSEENESYSLVFDSITVVKGQKASVKESTDGKDGLCCLGFNYNTTPYELELYDDINNVIKSEIELDDGTNLIKYEYKITEEADGIGPSKDSIVYDYFILNENDTGLNINYIVEPGDNDNNELIEKVIKTIVLN